MNAWALMPVYNEADILAAMLNHYVSRGVKVYVLDNWSTDDSAHIAATFRADDVWIERFPDKPTKYFEWGAILKRFEQIAGENRMGADWFILAAADEYIQTPDGNDDIPGWLARVDWEGYNAINYEIWNYKPHDDNFRPGEDDPVTYFTNYAINDWRGYDCACNTWRAASNINLTNSGAHSVEFAGKLVYPQNWVKRHYPIRGQTHGERKLFTERLPRFSPQERGLGWHVHYDWAEPGYRFIQ